MRIAGVWIEPMWALLLLAPIAGALALADAEPIWIFSSAALAIVPLAGLLGRATEELAHRLGAGVGGLLNASFGNAAELIIALAALRAGLLDVVKASITGSIIGNVLLVLGASVVAGGFNRERQKFNRTAASASATLLALSAIGLVVPAIFHFTVHGRSRAYEQELSVEIAVVLLLTYLAHLAFSLRTHRHLYLGRCAHLPEANQETHRWSRGRSLAVLLGATVLVALMSELLVGAVERAAHELGMTDVFVGVILVAVIGNAAEHATAVRAAHKDDMDLAMNIAVGSSLQIALFVAPLLVFAGYLFGQPMNLCFTVFEVLAVAISVGVLALIAMDGESNWIEGVQLLAVYLILGLAFYFLP